MAECVEGSVRLVDTSGLPTSDGNGLVEVCRNDYWSSVCHDNWDRQEAAMVCRQLGYDSTGERLEELQTLGRDVGSRGAAAPLGL